MKINSNEVDFLDFYRWLWNRHEMQKILIKSLYDSADTYCGLKFGATPDCDINVRMVEIMIELGYLNHFPTYNYNGIPLSYYQLVRDDDLINNLI